MRIIESSSSSSSQIGIYAACGIVLLVVAVYAVSLIISSRNKKRPSFEKVGTSYDHHGELLWICRSWEAKQVFTVRADVMHRAERRRTWSGGMDDGISKHLRQYNK